MTTTVNPTVGGLFLKRQLEQMLPKVLERRYKELPFENGTFVPTKPDLQPGAASVIQEQIETTGEAAVIADEAFDIPLSDASTSEYEYKIIAVYSGFHFTMRQLQAAQYSNVPLRDRKMFGARRAIAEKMNAIAAFGDSRYGVDGFLTNGQVPVSDLSLDIFDRENTTADDVIDLFMDEVTSIVENSEMTEAPNMALVSVRTHAELIKRRIPDTDINIKSYILQNSTYLEDIVPCNELSSSVLESNGVHAPGTNKDRMVIYPLSDEILERHIELVRPMPEEYRSGKYVVPMYACTTGTIWHYPKAGRYVDHPTFT
jgi:hypothetical protein